MCYPQLERTNLKFNLIGEGAVPLLDAQLGRIGRGVGLLHREGYLLDVGVPYVLRLHIDPRHFIRIEYINLKSN